MTKAEKKSEVQIEVVEDRELSSDEIDAIASLLARWWIRDFEERVDLKPEENTLEEK